MNSEALIRMALGLQSPWQINEEAFSTDDAIHGELHFRIGFK